MDKTYLAVSEVKLSSFAADDGQIGLIHGTPGWESGQ